jgi:hypothetical protein
MTEDKTTAPSDGNYLSLDQLPLLERGAIRRVDERVICAYIVAELASHSVMSRLQVNNEVRLYEAAAERYENGKYVDIWFRASVGQRKRNPIWIEAKRGETAARDSWTTQAKEVAKDVAKLRALNASGYSHVLVWGIWTPEDGPNGEDKVAVGKGCPHCFFKTVGDKLGGLIDAKKKRIAKAHECLGASAGEAAIAAKLRRQLATLEGELQELKSTEDLADAVEMGSLKWVPLGTGGTAARPASPDWLWVATAEVHQNVPHNDRHEPPTRRPGGKLWACGEKTAEEWEHQNYPWQHIVGTLAARALRRADLDFASLALGPGSEKLG